MTTNSSPDDASLSDAPLAYRRRDDTKPVHITMAGNFKGGTGKSSTTVNLACALARRGRYVLVVDMDPQGNATMGLAAQLTEDTATVSEAIKAAEPGCAADAIVSCGFDTGYAHRISVIGAEDDLTNRSNEWHVPGAANRLAVALDDAIDGFDVVLIDTPPGLGLLNQMALAAANDVLLVVQPEKDSMEGAVRLRDFVAKHARQLGNPALKPLGYVPSMVRELRVHKLRLEQMPGIFGDELVWAPAIPDRKVVKEAHEATPNAVALEQAGSMGEYLASLFDALADRYLAETGLL